jgi:hypothetical protein
MKIRDDNTMRVPYSVYNRHQVPRKPWTFCACGISLYNFYLSVDLLARCRVIRLLGVASLARFWARAPLVSIFRSEATVGIEADARGLVEVPIIELWQAEPMFPISCAVDSKFSVTVDNDVDSSSAYCTTFSFQHFVSSIFVEVNDFDAFLHHSA